MHTKIIRYFGRAAILACDGNCKKAWGVGARPTLQVRPLDPDNVVYLADHELGIAPLNPGTYGGGDPKPPHPRGMNRWCAEVCERAKIIGKGKPLEIPDFSVRQHHYTL